MATREEALYYHLRQLPNSPPVAWPGKNYRPVEGTTYLVPRYLPNQSDYGGVGVNAPKRHRGLFQVEVRGAADTGIADATIADAIVNHFEGEVINYQGFRIRIGTFDGAPALPVRGASYTDRGWNVTPVTIPWWSDEL